MAWMQKGSSDANLVEAARLICLPRPDRQADLINRLSRPGMLGFVTAWRVGEVIQPKRQFLRTQLNEVAKAAALLARAMTDWDIVIHIDNAGSNIMDPDRTPGFEHIELASQMSDLAARATNAAKGIPTKSGKEKARAMASGSARAPAVSAVVVSALLLLEAWVEVRGTDAGLLYKDGYNAAAEMWKASGGDTTRAPETWRRWIEEAQSLRISKSGMGGTLSRSFAAIMHAPSF